jgi:DDE family transposase
MNLLNNLGRVSVGIDPDTAAFAVHRIRQWWMRMGHNTRRPLDESGARYAPLRHREADEQPPSRQSG